MRKAVLLLLFVLTGVVVSCSSGGGNEPVCQTAQSKACGCGCNAKFDNGTVGTGASAVLSCQPNGQWNGVCEVGAACGTCGGTDSGHHDSGMSEVDAGQDAVDESSPESGADATTEASGGEASTDAPADVARETGGDATTDAPSDAHAHDASDASKDAPADHGGKG